MNRSWLPLIAVAGVLLAASPAASAGTFTGTFTGPVPVVRTQGMRLSSVQLPSVQLPPVTPGAVFYSDNWAGYAAVAKAGVQLRYAAADFTIASVNCADSPPGTSGYAVTSEWAGLDGFKSSSKTAEVIGVDSVCDGSGVPEYYASYEMVPLAPVTFTGVSPGDAIRVSVYFSASAYHLHLADLTTGGFINTTQPCPSGPACRNSSAEVITEDLGGAEPVNSLADFGMDNITGASVTSRSGTRGTLAAARLWTSREIVMSDKSGTVMARPSPLYGGQAFNVAWRSAS